MVFNFEEICSGASIGVEEELRGRQSAKQRAGCGRGGRRAARASVARQRTAASALCDPTTYLPTYLTNIYHFIDLVYAERSFNENLIMA